MATLFNNVANTLTTNFVPVQATFDTSGNFITFIGPGGVPFSTGSLTINTTSITGGTSGNILYDNAGKVGEKAVTGTGSVVLNSNPTFATDITVNGLTVGKGDGNISTNTAFGVDAIGSPAITALNTNNVGIGYETLNLVNVGVATITVTNGGSGYNDNGDDSFTYSATCTFVSGAPATVYPTVTLTVIGGVITSAVVTAKGYGFTVGSPTVMTVPDYGGYGGSGAVFNIGTYSVASNNTAVGYRAGNSNRAGLNSIYIGSNATGTGSNEIVIGSNISGNNDNSTVIGNYNTTNARIWGKLESDGYESYGGSFRFYGGNSGDSFTIEGTGAMGNINIGGEQASNPINIGLNSGPSANAQDVNIGLSIGNRVNIGASSGSSTINIGGPSATGTITLGRSTGAQSINIGSTNAGISNINIGGFGQGLAAYTININRAQNTSTTNISTGNVNSSNTKTVNIGTGSASSGSFTNINIGTASSGSNCVVTLNGIQNQQVFSVANLPTGINGSRAFVSNALAPAFGAAVVGGGGVATPVYHDGTIWRVG